MNLNLNTTLTDLDLVFASLACGAAIWLGTLLAKKQAQAFQGTGQNGLPAVTVSTYGDMRFLHLGSPAVQGSMRLSQPFDIHLEYVQRMMAWLLFADLDKTHQLHIMQLGLGAAALTKFSHHYLGAQTTAIELNPSVIETCRQSFNLPANSPRLQVLVGDAAEAVSQSTWLGQIDVLQVDLYDQDAAKPVLDTEGFYRQCRKLLTPEGCMVVNIFGHDCDTNGSLQTIMAAFGKSCVWHFHPTTAGNVIVFAFNSPREVDIKQLRQQANSIQSRWRLPASKWPELLISCDS